MVVLTIVEGMELRNNYKQTFGLGKKISLCDLLDKTQTAMGKRKFRKRLSAPITDPEKLNYYYNQIQELTDLDNCYSKVNSDKYGSPIYKLRNNLCDIKNIDNFIRKMITSKFHPSEVESFVTSLTNSLNSIELINKLKHNNTSLTNFLNIIPSVSKYKRKLVN